MSPSKIHRMLGIYNNKIRDIKIENDGIYVYLQRTSKNKLRCPKCKSEAIKLSGVRKRKIRDLYVMKRSVFIIVEQNKIKCERCGVLYERFSFVDLYARHTRRFEKFIHMLCREMTVSKVADIYGLSWDEVKYIDKKYLKKKYDKPKWKKLKNLGVDEIAVKKGHKYLTIVLNLETGEVIYVGKNRKQESLGDFFIKLGPIRCKRIQAIAMDNWTPYIAAAEKHLSKERIVFDKFHLICAYGKTLNEVRKEEYANSSKEEKEIIKGTRYLLLKPQSSLESDQKLHLAQLLSMNDNLNLAYILKDDFKQLWLCENRDEANKHLYSWMQMAALSGIKPLVKFSETLSKIKQGILNYFDFQITTAKVEGTNNKIKVLKRKAYGYRDINYFSLKIMDLHNISFGYG